MERRSSHILTALDRVYLARACELAARGVGSVSPNPPVGAVIVGTRGIIGEGFHHARGEAHAEVEALRDATARGHAAELAGATMYVSLEPCNHYGRTPPCSEAVVVAALSRVVIGALDPNPRTALGGVATLERAGVVVRVVDDLWARELIQRFATAVRLQRPYVTLKLAASLDGRIGPEPGSFWLTGGEARQFVQDLRAEHDAILVGARTVVVDDPLLTLRPPRARRRPLVRAVMCGVTPPPSNARIFASTPGAATLLLVPGAYLSIYAHLADLAEIVLVGDSQARLVDPRAALDLLYAREIAAVLCEGGPAIAGALLDACVVDRIEWLLVPQIFAKTDAPPVIAALMRTVSQFRFEDVRRLGPDLRLTIDLPHAFA